MSAVHAVCSDRQYSHMTTKPLSELGFQDGHCFKGASRMPQGIAAHVQP